MRKTLNISHLYVMLYFIGQLKNHGKIIVLHLCSKQLEIQVFLFHEKWGDLLCSYEMQSLLNVSWVSVTSLTLVLRFIGVQEKDLHDSPALCLISVCKCKPVLKRTPTGESRLFSMIMFALFIVVSVNILLNCSTVRKVHKL